MTQLLTGLSFDIGQREIYEDRVAVRHLRTRSRLELTVALVADGVGGANRGERAAQLALDVALHYMESGSAARDVPQLLTEAFTAANQAILDEYAATHGASTTLTAAVVHNNRLYVANTGDSRAYLCRGRSLIQLTMDHSFANVVPWTGAMSPEAAALNPRAHVLMHYLGQRAQPHVDHGIYGDAASSDALTPTTEPRVAYERGIKGLPLRPGDSVLVCSDGLVKTSPAGPPYATPEEIVRVLDTQQGDRAARSLVSFALGRDADDNVSVGLIQLAGRRGSGRALMAALLLLVVGVAGWFLWRSVAAAGHGPVATPATPQAQIAVGTSAIPPSATSPATATAAATATRATATAVSQSPNATRAATTAVMALTATRVAFCSLPDSYRYEVGDVTLEPPQIPYTAGNRFSSPIRVELRWPITNLGECPLTVRSIHRRPDSDDAPLAVVFERDGVALGPTLPPGATADLVAEVGPISTAAELRAWDELYKDRDVRWRLAVVAADGSGELRPVGQPSLPLNRADGQPWIVIRQATATATATTVPSRTPTPEPTVERPPAEDDEPAPTPDAPTPTADTPSPTPYP